MPVILTNLQNFKADDNETSNSPYTACVQALCKINQCLEDDVIPMYTEFIDSKFNLNSLYQAEHSSDEGSSTDQLSLLGAIHQQAVML